MGNNYGVKVYGSGGATNITSASGILPSQVTVVGAVAARLKLGVYLVNSGTSITCITSTSGNISITGKRRRR